MPATLAASTPLVGQATATGSPHLLLAPMPSRTHAAAKPQRFQYSARYPPQTTNLWLAAWQATVDKPAASST